MRDSHDAVKTRGRMWPSVVFAPLTIPALFIAEGVLLERIDDIGLFVFMALAFSLPLSYLASLALGLPTFVWLRRHNLDRLWIMLALGLICGAVVLVGVMSFIGPGFGNASTTAIHGAIYGSAYATAWKLIDGSQVRDMPANKPLQPASGGGPLGGSLGGDAARG